MGERIEKLRVLGLIPARGGSKGIPKKNIKTLFGKPLLAHAIEMGKESKYINKVVCSTDSEEIAVIAQKWGAEVPFLRPSSMAEDNVNDAPFTKHAIEWLRDNQSWKADIVVILRPTSPLNNSKHIDKAIIKLWSNKDAHSIKSIIPCSQTPFKMWITTDTEYIVPLLNCNVFEAYNSDRQLLPKVFWQNGYVDIVKADIVLRNNSAHGFKIIKDWGASGFRAGMAFHNGEWMQELACEYDSSYYDTDPYQPMGGGCGRISPFMLGRLVELPRWCWQWFLHRSRDPAG